MSVSILVGKEKHSFHLDEDQLCKCSSFFDSALRGGFKESKEFVVQLPEADVEAFQVFEKWIVQGSVPAAEGWQLTFKRLAWQDKLEDMDLSLLYKSFLIDFLQVSELRRPLLNALISKQKKIRIVPISLLPDIYENTLPGSPLRKIWIRWVMETPAPEIFEDGKWEFPEEFLRELAAAQTRYTLRLAEKLGRSRARELI
ncbi:hypothetical protein B0J14DRAFT_601423 [Halenospora varia]|nr:hypothetical protein B0J14DRAFT_601423 [Halenospora varia]